MAIRRIRTILAITSMCMSMDWQWNLKFPPFLTGFFATFFFTGFSSIVLWETSLGRGRQLWKDQRPRSHMISEGSILQQHFKTLVLTHCHLTSESSNLSVHRAESRYLQVETWRLNCFHCTALALVKIHGFVFCAPPIPCNESKENMNAHNKVVPCTLMKMSDDELAGWVEPNGQTHSDYHSNDELPGAKPNRKWTAGWHGRWWSDGWLSKKSQWSLKILWWSYSNLHEIGWRHPKSRSVQVTFKSLQMLFCGNNFACTLRVRVQYLSDCFDAHCIQDADVWPESASLTTPIGSNLISATGTMQTVIMIISQSISSIIR